MVAAGVDEFLGGGEIVFGAARCSIQVLVPRILGLAEEEAGAVEVDVGHEKSHGAALGDFPGFVQVFLRALGAGTRVGEKTEPGACEEAEDDELLPDGPAEAFYGGINVGNVRG